MRCVSLLPLLAATLAAQDRIDFTTDLYPGGGVTGDQQWIVSRVVDDISGAPIAGAEVFLVRESETPIAGEFWHTRAATTDANGYLRVRVDDIEGQWHIMVLRHAQHGLSTRSGRAEVWRIGRAFDVPVLITNHRGEPTAGAKIGFCGGCGHTPDLTNATTGADGIAILRGIDPHNDIGDVYVQHPGLGLGYESFDWYPGDPPAIVDCPYAPAMSGKVLDHQGKPVAGVFVAAMDVHRGPWARTAADGTFTLLGGKPSIGASHVRMPDGREIEFPTAAQYPVTMRLPDLDDPDADEGTLDAPERERIVIPSKPLKLELTAPDDVAMQVLITHPGIQRGEGMRGGFVDAPQTGPFEIHVFPRNSQGCRPSIRVFAIGDYAEISNGRLPIAWFAPTTLRVAVADEAGKPVAAKVRLRRRWETGEDREEGTAFVECEAGAASLTTWYSGRALLEIEPLVAGLRSRLHWVTLPLMTPDARTHDIGTVALSKAPLLTVLAADGSTLPDAKVTYVAPGMQEVESGRTMRLDDAGGWFGPDLREGDAIVVQRDDDAVPFRTVLAGVGPWNIRVPDGSLDVEVLGPDGEAIEACVSFGEHAREGKGTFALRGLPLGALRMFVAADNCRTADITTTITANTRTLRVLLPGR